MLKVDRPHQLRMSRFKGDSQELSLGTASFILKETEDQMAEDPVCKLVNVAASVSMFVCHHSRHFLLLGVLDNKYLQEGH